MSAAIRAFLRDIDGSFRAPPPPPRLSIIGSSALMLQTKFLRATKDSDVVETNALTGDVAEALLRLAGPGSALHARHRLYLDMVPRGLPFLPQRPLWHALDLGAEGPLHHLEVEVLDVVDVVVSKLKRFSPNDRSDIDAMVDAGHVAHDALLDRFRLAVDAHFHDESLPRYCANLNAIERDAFDCEETPISLPAWIQ